MDHHAYCYVGIDFGRTTLKDRIEATDPDVVVSEYVDFGINEARQLAEQAYRAPVAAEKQTFIIVAGNLTHEAQNALLKILEEPPVRSVFHMVVPQRGMLLPTLQSRLHFLESTDQPMTVSEELHAFMQAPYAERLSQVTTLAKDKDMAAIGDLLTAAELVATRRPDRELLNTVLFIRDRLGRRGSSTKMLLELLALRLPHS